VAAEIELRSKEVAEKLARIRRLLRDEGLEGALFTTQESVAWVTAGAENRVVRGSNPGLVWALVTEGGASILTQNVEGPRLVTEEHLEALGFDVQMHEWWEEPGTLLPSPTTLLVDWDVPGVQRRDLVRALRIPLTETEQDRVRMLARDVVTALESTAAECQRGTSERAVAARLAGALEEFAVFPIVLLVGGDERRRAFRHPVPTDALIERDAFVAVVGVRHGLHVAVTRSVSFGPSDPELVDRHLAAATVDSHLVGSTRPGASWGEAIQAGVDAYADLGYSEEWRRHYQGGPIGYAVREFNPTPPSHENAFTSQPVLAGQAVAWNPTVQGAKSEDTFLVTEAGNECLTAGAREWPMLRVTVGDVVLARPAILEL
jgi:Xaa-Pro aminopeptidase